MEAKDCSVLQENERARSEKKDVDRDKLGAMSQLMVKMGPGLLPGLLINPLRDPDECD